LRLLLDTHCWLWLLSDPERLSAPALEMLGSFENELLLSAASSWEIAIKYELGRLTLPEPPGTFVPDRMESSGVVGLPIQHAHALQVASLPMHHKDPFDRLLIAQAQVEGLTVVTVDDRFASYDVSIHWAT
jgi:PIN domain nuclease of toxin-antitoxin system